MRDWLERWLTECVVGHLNQATVDHYRGIVKNHLLPELGHIQLNLRSPGHVQSLQQKLLEKEHQEQHKSLLAGAYEDLDIVLADESGSWVKSHAPCPTLMMNRTRARL